MNTYAYNNNAMTNLWNYLQGLSLSATDSRWLADHLIQNADKQEKECQQVSAKDLHGIWGDDGINADDAVAELKEMRSFNHKSIQL